jgi:hypothetical protein
MLILRIRIRNTGTNPPEEDVVSLVVEGGDSLPLELRIVVEQGGQHPEIEFYWCYLSFFL